MGEFKQRTSWKWEKKLSSEMLTGVGKCGGRRGKQIVYIKMRKISVRIQERFSKCG
jgi:hypothetical protein